MAIVVDDLQFINNEFLVDALVGACASVHNIDFWDSLVESGFAKFSGNQHNADWIVHRHKLEKLTLPSLIQLYFKAVELKYRAKFYE